MQDNSAARREAIRRAMEMQARAKKPPEKTDDPPEAPAETANVFPAKETAPEQGKPGADIFSLLMRDKEKTLLLLLLLLLSTDSCDPALLFVLLYLCV